MFRTTINAVKRGLRCMHSWIFGQKRCLYAVVCEYLNGYGYIALTFFHRGFAIARGENAQYSDGAVRDIVNATTFIQQRTEVDPEK